MNVNKHFGEVAESYLFSTIAKKVSEYKAANPERKIISLGIGDVTLPLCSKVVEAMKAAVTEQGEKEHFHGYGPEQGYAFLKDAIKGYYVNRHVELQSDEIFISDGAKSDIGNILDLFDADNTAIIPNPVYPVYMDTNIMAGRRMLYMNANEDNDFLPMPCDIVDKDGNILGIEAPADIIYLCSPNNPTGAVYSKGQLKLWIEFAKKKDAIILFDAAYETFIDDDSLPHSIYEVSGARDCAIEICSFSKTAGFTGTRCGYTIVPTDLTRQGMKLNKMWLRRQTTKFNGVSYIVQRGAEAVFTPEGQLQVKNAIAYYSDNAHLIMDTLKEMGIKFTGGMHSPYVWMRVPGEMTSWQYFDYLLTEKNIVVTPGSGFGANGEGYVRLTAFGDAAATKEAMQRLKS